MSFRFFHPRRLAAVAVLIAGAITLPVPARASPDDAYQLQPAVPTQGADPRYPYSLDVYGIVGFLASLSGFGLSETGFGGGLTFGLPIAENRQLIFGARSVEGSSTSGNALSIGGLAGYRIMTYTDTLRTRLDLCITGDYSYFRNVFAASNNEKPASGPGVGGILTVGINYYFVRWFGLGLNVSASVYAINLHFLLDAEPIIIINW